MYACTRYADGSRQKQKTRNSVYNQGTVHPCGSGSGLRAPLTGRLARTNRASAPKPTRMAVGLTRDCRETLRREVQGSSESSTRRSANSKRHVGAPNRHTTGETSGRPSLQRGDRAKGSEIPEAIAHATHAGHRVEADLSQRSIAAQRRPRPPGHRLGSQRVRVHRDVSRHPRSSRFPPPSRTSGSKRTAERRKVARRQLSSTTRAPGWLALGSSLRQQGGRRVQVGRRAVKVWRALGGGTVPVAH